MDPHQIANQARKFLNRYTVKKRFFSPPNVVQALADDPEDEEALANTVLMFQHSVPKEAPGELLFICSCGKDLSEKDPAVTKAADECMTEVKAAMPELAAYKIEVQIKRGT